MTGNRISNKKTLWEKKGGRTFHGDLDTGKYREGSCSTYEQFSKCRSGNGYQ